jgi:NTP pyrophosphatase (non-canonical NTP hydrolase)
MILSIGKSVHLKLRSAAFNVNIRRQIPRERATSLCLFAECRPNKSADLRRSLPCGCYHDFNTAPQAGPLIHTICSGFYRENTACVPALRNTESHSTVATRKTLPGQIVLFPDTGSEFFAAPDKAAHMAVSTSLSEARSQRTQVVLSGSYRKDFQGLKRTYEQLRDLNCDILSPSNVTAVSEVDGFVYMQGEESQAPDSVEARHLDAIQKSQFMWLHAPSGYVGTSAALEIGFANAAGVPVFSQELVNDPILRRFVHVVSSPGAVISQLSTGGLPIPEPALRAFQYYYRRAAIQRGYHSEGPKECLLLMVEEVGELAREIRKRERLVRHGASTGSSESRELADIFLYVIHMANVLDIDLARVVQDKELINLQRASAR